MTEGEKKLGIMVSGIYSFSTSTKEKIEIMNRAIGENLSDGI